MSPNDPDQVWAEPASIGPEVYTCNYSFETENLFYQLPTSSPLAKDFLALSAGCDKVEFLKEHGACFQKKSVSERGRIMIHFYGPWMFWNEGQFEYLVPGEGENGEDTVVGKEFEEKCGSWDLDQRREWVIKHAVRIKEWPTSIYRPQSMVTQRAATESKQETQESREN